MGLDAFRTDSDSSDSSSGGGSSSQSKRTQKKPEYDGPHFIALFDIERERIKTFKGDKAFGPGSRHKHEQVLVTIESEDVFERANEKSQRATELSIDALIRHKPKKAVDLIERVQEAGSMDLQVTCPVCGKDIDIVEEEYEKLAGQLIHGDHKVGDVMEEVEVEA